MSSLDATLSEFPTSTNTNNKSFSLKNAFAIAASVAVGATAFVLAVTFAGAATGPGLLGMAGAGILGYIGGRLSAKACIATYKFLS